ncbi:MAG: hypothetical protein EOO16_01110 [Chitinophagaceae bacterium]|nr:MAG: hypothetical protein EOO16_01110 [Chitinophagaceae bacterium]
MNLLLSLRAEFRKTKRTAVWPFALGAAAFIPVMYFFNGFDSNDPELITDPWGSLVRKGFFAFGGGIFPLFTTLCCALVPQIEYRNDTWKQVRITPQPPLLLFFGKYVQILLILLYTLVLFNAMLFAAAGGKHLLHPGLGYGNHPFDPKPWLVLNGRIFVSLLGLSALYFWLGLRFRNFIVPVATGFVFWLLGCWLLFDAEVDAAAVIPHTLPALVVTDEKTGNWLPVELTSLVYGAGFLVLGYIDFRRMKH